MKFLIELLRSRVLAIYYHEKLLFSLSDLSGQLISLTRNAVGQFALYPNSVARWCIVVRTLDLRPLLPRVRPGAVK